MPQTQAKLAVINKENPAMKAKEKKQKSNTDKKPLFGKAAAARTKNPEKGVKEPSDAPVSEGGKKAVSKKKKGGKTSTLIILIVLIAGLSLLLYPTVSDYWNSLHSSKAIADYAEAVGNMNEEEYEKLLNAAYEYNERLAERENTFLLNDEQKEEYYKLLDVSGTGMIGYVEVPSLGISLPVYHGTDEAVLQIAVGHIEWSSLPVGGENTHSVLSGHRGLPSAKLFSDLDELEVGDIFIIRVLNEIFTYEVDQILIVTPDDSDSMVISAGQDLCTLVTCTPYGINSHRLLIRGHRTENLEEAKTVRVTADAVQIEPMIVAPIVAIPILFVLLMVLLFKPKKKKTPKKITKDDFLH